MTWNRITITVTSQVGVGSTFHVTLPAVAVTNSQTVGDLLAESVIPSPDGVEAPNAPDWSLDQLDETARARLPELYDLLSAEAELVSTLRSTMSINEIGEFAERMEILGEECDVPPLVAWAQDLGKGADMFDTNRLVNTFESYDRLLQAIESGARKPTRMD